MNDVTAPTLDNGCPLLVTKLHIPTAHANLTQRPQLLTQLNAGLRGNLVVVSAPAGFGKTTLLAQWHAQAGALAMPHRMAWVTLDAGDNDVRQFWRYVVAALQRAQPGLGDAAQALLAANQTALETVLTTLLNELLTSPADYLLVLDDYHLIETQAVHESLAFLLDHLPDNLHLALLSRSDPPLPLARLRLAGALTEVRATDLQFTNAETAAFLNQTMGLALAPADIATLVARTEGWITGLQAAALSLQGQADPGVVIRAFSGTQRYILDYLVEEVLQQQPPARQTFLLHTAILNRLCGPLCDAVMGWALPAAAADPPSTKSQAILEALEHANLFITPLDDTRTWYRYHPLFADLLRKRLYATQPTLPPTLHQRVALWYEAREIYDEAVAHALAAHDLPLAARLLGPIAPRLIMQGELTKLRQWLQALPDDQLHADPELALAAAWLALLSGEVAHLTPHLQAVEGCLARITDNRQREAILARSQAIRALLAVIQGDLAVGRDLAQQAQRRLLGHYPLARSLLTFAQGVVEQTQGKLAAARRAFAQAQAKGEASHNLLVALLANRYRVNLEIAAGCLQQAVDLAQAALTLSEAHQEAGAPRLPIAGAAHVGLGRVLFEWNDLTTAQQHLAQGVAWAGEGGGLGVACEGYLLLADLHQARGEPDAAWRALWAAERHLQRSPQPDAGAQMAFFQARLALAQGDRTPFHQWLTTTRLTVEDAVTPANLTRYLTFARWLLAEQQLTPAHTLLARLEAYAAGAGWHGHLITIQVLQALTLQRQEKTADALAILQQALALAAPAGYVRTFVQEGDALYALLAECGLRCAASAPPLFAYVNRLLAAFGPAPTTTGPGEPLATTDLAPAILELVEPISERERQVLHLLAGGATNQVIAEELVIALTTAKKHVSNIIGKLGATNRTQAVVRARALGLLP